MEKTIQRSSVHLINCQLTLDVFCLPWRISRAKGFTQKHRNLNKVDSSRTCLIIREMYAYCEKHWKILSSIKKKTQNLNYENTEKHKEKNIQSNNPEIT